MYRSSCKMWARPFGDESPWVSKNREVYEMSARLQAGALLTVLALAACHRSGTWSDDPKNFERAWANQRRAASRSVTRGTGVPPTLHVRKPTTSSLRDMPN